VAAAEEDIEAKYLSEPGPSGLFGRLARVTLLLDDFLRRCFEPYGLRNIDYTVLRVLQLAGPPYQMSPSELSAVVVRSTGGMTQILDRLEQIALVARSPNPLDRRKVIVGLTKKGVRLTERANKTYADRKAQLLEQFGPGEVEHIDQAVLSLMRVLAADWDQTRGG
jgi:DNA-binding MarR family transcriptional regulator